MPDGLLLWAGPERTRRKGGSHDDDDGGGGSGGRGYRLNDNAVHRGGHETLGVRRPYSRQYSSYSESSSVIYSSSFHPPSASSSSSAASAASRHPAAPHLPSSHPSYAHPYSAHPHHSSSVLPSPWEGGDFVYLGLEDGNLLFGFNLGDGDVFLLFNATKLSDGRFVFCFVCSLGGLLICFLVCLFVSLFVCSTFFSTL